MSIGVPASAQELADFETDVLAGFGLVRASAGLADSTIRNDTNHLGLIRDWFGRALWEMQPTDAGAYLGKVPRDARPSTRTGRAAALTVYFQFLELRHKLEIYNLTGRLAECPLNETNRPKASAGEETEQLFAGWREELATCRKFAPAARDYAAARLAADVGLRVNEACCWTWTMCGGSSAVSASSTSATARARSGRGRRALPAGLGGQGDAACAAALLWSSVTAQHQRDSTKDRLEIYSRSVTARL